jgi:predicted murein hydrolase (TIGR00659 family)
MNGIVEAARALGATSPVTLLQAAAAIAATAAAYYGAAWLQRRVGSFLLNPVLVAVTVLIVALELAGISFAAYNRGGALISFFLGPAVVALGVPLHHQAHEITRRGMAILASIVIGSLVGILSGTVLAALLGAEPAIVRTLAARSVTTPIAIAVTARVGGVPPLAAAISIATGLVGAVIGPRLLRALGVRSATAFGLAMGSAAHGIGTARAAEEGQMEGATSGLAIGLMGLATAILAPLALLLLRWLGLV